MEESRIGFAEQQIKFAVATRGLRKVLTKMSDKHRKEDGPMK